MNYGCHQVSPLSKPQQIKNKTVETRILKFSFARSNHDVSPCIIHFGLQCWYESRIDVSEEVFKFIQKLPKISYEKTQVLKGSSLKFIWNLFMCWGS